MEIVLLIGPPGSGKTSYSKEHFPTALRISQDEMGKEEHLTAYLEALENQVPLIVVDRINHVRDQRERYLKPAKAKGYTTRIVLFKTPYATCKERLLNRKDHPTIPFGNEEIAQAALGNFYYQYEDVVPTEVDQVTHIG